MANIIFVTGFHRAGTHSAARYLSSEHKLSFLEEIRIRWDSFEAVKLLCAGRFPKWDGKQLVSVQGGEIKHGFILQCPGLAHKTLELAKLGKVYWCQRELLSTVNSMKNIGLGKLAWGIVKKFNDEFPDDPVWINLKYNGKEDVYADFTGYYALLCKIKQYFFETYFKNICEVISLENTKYFEKTRNRSQLKPTQLKLIEETVKANESICIR